MLVLVTGISCVWDQVYNHFPSQKTGSNITLGDSDCWTAPLQSEPRLVIMGCVDGPFWARFEVLTLKIH